MEEKPQFKWGVVLVSCIAIFIIVLDSSAMNVAISAVVVDLHTDLSTIQALIAIYALTMASLMLAGSKLQDVLGRKKTFFIGVIVYGIGTTTATLSINVFMLLIGWSLLEGIGAALMLPATTTMVSAAYEGKDRLTAFGIWGGIAALGAAIGPLYGGALTSFATWRLIFAFELLGVLAVIVMRSYLRESKPRLAWRDIDLGGVVLSVIALFSLVFGILLLGSPQYWQLVPLFIVVGLIVFAAFLLWQRRRISHDAEPLLDISMLKNRLYVLGNAASAIQQIAFAGVLFILPVFLLQVTRVSAFMTGVALLPLSVAIFVLSLTGGRLSSIVRPKVVILVAFLISAAGAYLLSNVFSQSTQIVDIIPGTVIFGLGVGLLLSQLTNLTMSAVRKDQEIDASGFLNTAKNLGYSVGTALVGAILLVGIFNGLVAGISTSTLVSNGTTQAQIQQNLYAYAQNMQTSAPPSIPQNLIPEAQRIVDSTISSAMHLTFVSLALILLLGFVIVLFLPRQAK
ncbi:MAG: MFS transporter [Halobacteriota archaeon]|jgi:EmrB/QacA subfamily drug resistance transporter